MSINKSFPNYQKSIIPDKIISKPPGMNRKARRQISARVSRASKFKFIASK